ncbi:MAG: Crp/Fnr family transcriptional regulator [Turicibacter sp.]
MTLSECITFLIQTKTFCMFTYSELDSMFTHDTVTIKKLDKNNILFLSGEKCESLNIIVSGEIMIQKFDNNGNILTITSFNSGQTFGDNLLFGENNKYPFSIIAKTDSTVIKLNKNLVFKLLQKNEKFLSIFLQNISNHSFFVGQRMISLTGKTLREKIIDFIKEEQFLQQRHTIYLTISKKELAEKFSVHRPSLSREFKKMKDDGLIVYDHLSITPLINLTEN